MWAWGCKELHLDSFVVWLYRATESVPSCFLFPVCATLLAIVYYEACMRCSKTAATSEGLVLGVPTMYLYDFIDRACPKARWSS